MNTGDLSDLNHLARLPERKDFRIGCIGAGFIMADCHLVAYRQAGFNPVAIASRSPEKAREVAARHDIPTVYETVDQLIADESLEVIDVAVPPDVQVELVRRIADRGRHLKGLLLQKPLAGNFAEARQIVELCHSAGIVLAVNQNMRYDHSIRACRQLLDRGDLGEPVLATIEMRAVPHWMPWQQRQGWVTLRIMSIHHLDAFRYIFGDPDRVLASVRPDPRTEFPHEDGIALYILEYEGGLRCSAWDDVWTGPAKEGAESDIGIRWRVEGTEGLALGTIGWPAYPERQPSTIDFTTTRSPGRWYQPRWDEVWFPDAFAGPMAELLVALEENTQPPISGWDNLNTMVLVDACYVSAREHRAVSPREIVADG